MIALIFGAKVLEGKHQIRQGQVTQDRVVCFQSESSREFCDCKFFSSYIEVW